MTQSADDFSFINLFFFFFFVCYSTGQIQNETICIRLILETESQAMHRLPVTGLKIINGSAHEMDGITNTKSGTLSKRYVLVLLFFIYHSSCTSPYLFISRILLSFEYNMQTCVIITVAETVCCLHSHTAKCM